MGFLSLPSYVEKALLGWLLALLIIYSTNPNAESAAIQDARQQQRIALVIGNAAYEPEPLSTPVNDAHAISEKLEELGFQVTLRLNLNKHEMEESLDRFSKDLREGKVGLLYYSGYAIHSDKDSFLLPTGVATSFELDQHHYIVSLGSIFRKLDRSDADGAIVILDSFHTQPDFSIQSKGMYVEPAKVMPPAEILFFASSQSAQNATNAVIGHSIFTQELIQSLDVNGITAIQAFKRTAIRVRLATDNRHPPSIAGFIEGQNNFYFRNHASQNGNTTSTNETDISWIDLIGSGELGQAKISGPAIVNSIRLECRNKGACSNNNHEVAGNVDVSGFSEPGFQEGTQVSRFPTIETKPTVSPKEHFTALVSLTQDQITPEVNITQGNQTEAGKLALDLPQNNNEWQLEVILSAPGFEIHGSNSASITLPRDGDSTPARFELSALPIDEPERSRKLYATFWHQGSYLGKAVRPITVRKEQPRSVPRHKASLISQDMVETSFAARSAPPSFATTPQASLKPVALRDSRPLGLDFTQTAPDLTLWVLHHPEDEKRLDLMIHSPHLQPRVDKVSFPQEQASKWLGHRLSQLAGKARGLDLEEGPIEKKDAAFIRGLGRELYNEFAPEGFKKAFWTLKEKLGDDFDSIQIFSNNPIIPWELMRPYRGDEESDFLGLEYRIARWHVDQGEGLQLDRPPQELPLGKLLVIAPEYSDSPLPQAQREQQTLTGIEGFTRFPASADSVTNLLGGDELPQGIIHFAGHGDVRRSESGITDYVIRLQDAELDAYSLRGLMRPGTSDNHPMFFFNACEVGVSEQSVQFVSGWAPTLLATGASGFIGGLWPLDDAGAARFAIAFYQRMAQSLRQSGKVMIAENLRQTRRQLHAAGDPIALAYVFYGDPDLRLSRP